MKNLKQKIKQGETVFGCWLNLGSPLTAEMVGRAGFDWVLIDLEHGAGDEKDVLFQLQALEHTPAAALIRVENADRQRIHRVLDLGAEGIMCPHVSTGEEAAAVVSGMFYPPHGSRGVAKTARAAGFGSSFDAYAGTARDNLVGIVQIETPEALHHLDEIAAVDGVDVLFIGPADLTISLGIFGQFDHPVYKDALKRTVAAAEKAGKATGILIFSPDDYTLYAGMGIRMIACGADGTFVAEGARNMIARLRGSENKQ